MSRVDGEALYTRKLELQELGSASAVKQPPLPIHSFKPVSSRILPIQPPESCQLAPHRPLWPLYGPVVGGISSCMMLIAHKGIRSIPVHTFPTTSTAPGHGER